MFLFIFDKISSQALNGIVIYAKRQNILSFSDYGLKIFDLYDIIIWYVQSEFCQRRADI